LLVCGLLYGLLLYGLLICGLLLYGLRGRSITLLRERRLLLRLHQTRRFRRRCGRGCLCCRISAHAAEFFGSSMLCAAVWTKCHDSSLLGYLFARVNTICACVCDRRRVGCGLNLSFRPLRFCYRPIKSQRASRALVRRSWGKRWRLDSSES